MKRLLHLVPILVNCCIDFFRFCNTPVISSAFEIRVFDKKRLIRVELLGEVYSDCVSFRSFSFFTLLSEKDAHQLLRYLVGYPICLASWSPGEFASLDPTVTWNCAEKFRQHQPNIASEWDGRTFKKIEMGENETQMMFLMSTRNLARSLKKIGHGQRPSLELPGTSSNSIALLRFVYLYFLWICWVDEAKRN